VHVSTRLIHADEPHRPAHALTPPIAQPTNAAIPTAEEFAEIATTALHPGMYNRHGNANHEQATAILAELEGAERGLLTSAGMGAATTAILTLLKAGDHVIGQRSIYAGVTSWMLNLLPRFGVETTIVDQTDATAFENAYKPNTTLVLLETPSNPRLEITDLNAVTAQAVRHGATTLCDNTFATPINQRPLDHGVDLVWHSATKYLGGHADLMAGAILGDEPTIERLWHTAQTAGAVLSPFNAWLLLRGLRTLELRVERHNHNAQALAEALHDHPRIAVVHYPGLRDHPGHATAARQMSGYGGVLSFELEDGYEAADRFISNLRLAKRAASLGHVASLVVHPAAMWSQSLTPEQLADAGVSPGLVRFATGIEHAGDRRRALRPRVTTTP
jgi:methionine-gamma-lyase